MSAQETFFIKTMSAQDTILIKTMSAQDTIFIKTMSAEITIFIKTMSDHWAVLKIHFLSEQCLLKIQFLSKQCVLKMHFLSKQCLLKMQFLSVDTNIQLLEFFIPTAATSLWPKTLRYVAKCTHATPDTPVILVALVNPLTPVQCLAGYYHIKYGHLLDKNYKWGVKLIPARNLISTPCIRAVSS